MSGRAKLPVFKTIGAAFTSVGDHAGDFMNVSVSVFIWIFLGGIASIAVANLTGTAEALFDLLAPQKDSSRGNGAALIAALPFVAAALYSFVSMAIAWHRLIILNERPAFFVLSTWRRVISYGIKGFLLVLIVAVCMSVALVFRNAVYGLVIFIPAILGALIVMARCSVALPGTAVDQERWTLGRSWDVTRGNSWRLVFAALLAQFPFNFADRVLEKLSEASGDNLGAVAIFGVVSMIVGIWSALVGVGVLSHAYLHFAAAPSAEAPGAMSEEPAT